MCEIIINYYYYLLFTKSLKNINVTLEIPKVDGHTYEAYNFVRTEKSADFYELIRFYFNHLKIKILIHNLI